MEAAINWDWTTFREYMDVVDKLPKTINYAANIGHSALRTHVMGERAFEQQATADDMGAMEHELLDALDAGAIGFTSSRSTAHRLPQPDNRLRRFVPRFVGGDEPARMPHGTDRPRHIRVFPGTRRAGRRIRRCARRPTTGCSTSR